jgi:hypothetical protein
MYTLQSIKHIQYLFIVLNLSVVQSAIYPAMHVASRRLRQKHNEMSCTLYSEYIWLSPQLQRIFVKEYL